MHNFLNAIFQKLFGWWVIRYLSVHQRVLEESSATLHSLLPDDIAVESYSSLHSDVTTSAVMTTLLHLELAYTYLLYGDVTTARRHFEKAYQAVGFQVHWLGKKRVLNSFIQKLLIN